MILAKHVVPGPFATTRKQLLNAVTTTMIFVCVVAAVVGSIRGVHTALDMLLGAAIVLLPSGWVALSLTAERSAFSPVWLGLARYGLASLGFAVLFAMRPGSDPLAVLAGSVMGLLLPTALIAKKGSGQYGGSEN